jgi:hypothetical protein
MREKAAPFSSDTTRSIITVKLEQELAALKQRRRSVHPDEMHALLTEAGFDKRFGKGDHWVYTQATDADEDA